LKAFESGVIEQGAIRGNTLARLRRINVAKRMVYTIATPYIYAPKSPTDIQSHFAPASAPKVSTNHLSKNNPYHE